MTERQTDRLLDLFERFARAISRERDTPHGTARARSEGSRVCSYGAAHVQRHRYRRRWGADCADREWSFIVVRRCARRGRERARHRHLLSLDLGRADAAMVMWRDTAQQLREQEGAVLGYLTDAGDVPCDDIVDGVRALVTEREAYRVQHELIGDPANLAAEVERLRMALVKIESTPCSDECGCCGMDGRTAHDALVSTSATPTKSETPT